MRIVPSALQDKLASPSMALATLIKIIVPNEKIICLTTWDKPLLVNLDGEGFETYIPSDIESVSQFSVSINAAIDDGEISVPIGDLFVADDIRRSFYNGSIVRKGYVDPHDLDNPFYYCYYETGQIKIEGLRIKFELLGPEKRLETPVNIPLTLNCRYQFGDEMCGINLEVEDWSPFDTINIGDERKPVGNSKVWFYAAEAGTGGIGTTGPYEPVWPTSGDIIDNDIVWRSFPARRVMGVVTAVTDARNFGADGIDIGEDFFGEGYVIWLYGRNAGEKQRIRFDSGTGSIIQHRPCLDIPQIGDTFWAVVGCRKRLTEDCVQKHDNRHRSSSRTLRFGGFPFLAPEDVTATAPKENNN